MEMSNIKSYLDGYLDFLKGNSFERKITENATKLTLPFLDGLGDCTEIYIIKQNNNDFIVTDNGATISNLEFMGFTLKGGYKEAVFNKITKSYGVLRENLTLFVKANLQDLFLKKHMLLQCINKLNDMYMLNRENVQNIFLEDVKEYFDQKELRYIPDHRLTGVSGLTANYEFAIPKSKKLPLTLIKTLNNLSTSNVKSTIFDWNDTKNSSEDKMDLIVLYNDENKKPNEENISALNSYEISNVSWSEREKLIERLVG